MIGEGPENLKKNSFILGLAALLLLFVVGGCSNGGAVGETEAEMEDIPVEVMEVGRKTIERYVEQSGNIDSDGHVNVTSQLVGKVEEIAVSVGSQVEKGATLVRLDNKELASQLRRTEAELEQVEHSYYISKNIGLPQKLAQAENRVKEAAIEYENTKKSLERITALYEVDAVSQEDLEQVESRYTLVKMGYETAQDSLAREKESQGRELSILEAQLKSARAALESTRLNFQKSRLEAPIQGTVTSVTAKIGQEISPGTPLVTLVDYTSTYVELNLTERLLAEIQEGTDVLIEIPLTGKQYQGTVEVIDLTPLPGTRTYPAKAYFETDSHVHMGQQATLQVLVERAEEVLAIPSHSIMKDHDTNTVFVVEEGIARERIVITGVNSGATVEILEGLHEGEKLVVEGQQFLHDGRHVKIVDGELR